MGGHMRTRARPRDRIRWSGLNGAERPVLGSLRRLSFHRGLGERSCTLVREAPGIVDRLEAGVELRSCLRVANEQEAVEGEESIERVH